MTARDKIIDSVRLAPHECQALLDALDRASGNSPGASKRVTKRWRYRNRILASIKQGGVVQSFFVSPRNISNGGIAFLHGGYVHPGNAVAVALRDRKSKVHTLRGRVARCSHVSGRLHEVAVQLESKINPKDFVPPGDEPAFNIEHVDITRLNGRALVVEDFRPDQRLIAHYFKETSLDLSYAQSIGEASSILDNTIDLVFLDATLPDGVGPDSVTKFRALGYAGPLISIIPEQNPALRSRLLEAGANEVLAKPIDLSLLRQAAAEYLVAGGCEPEVASMMYSTKTEDSYRELIAFYVLDCHKLSDSIADAVEAENLKQVRTLIDSIRGSASAHGFEQLDRVAMIAVREIDVAKTLEEAMISVQAVINACRRTAVRERGSSAAA